MDFVVFLCTMLDEKSGLITNCMYSDLSGVNRVALSLAVEEGEHEAYTLHGAMLLVFNPFDVTKPDLEHFATHFLFDEMFSSQYQVQTVDENYGIFENLPNVYNLAVK